MLFFTLAEYGKSIKFWNFKVGQGIYACVYPPIGESIPADISLCVAKPHIYP